MEGRGGHCVSGRGSRGKEGRVVGVWWREGDRRGSEPEKGPHEAGLEDAAVKDLARSRPSGLDATGCIVLRWQQECTPVYYPPSVPDLPGPPLTTAGQGKRVS